jgi:hypothetical protein
VRLVPSSNRPCLLTRGQVRRVPQNRGGFLVGYHVCCPRCGFVTPALQGDAGLEITEATDPADITFSRPWRCTYCQVLMRAHHGEFELVEDACVRNVQFR